MGALPFYLYLENFGVLGNHNWIRLRIRNKVRILIRQADLTVGQSTLPSVDRSAEPNRSLIMPVSRPNDRSNLNRNWVVQSVVRLTELLLCTLLCVLVDRVDRPVFCSGYIWIAFSLLLDSVLCTISSNELKNSPIKLLSPLSLQFSTSVKIFQI